MKPQLVPPSRTYRLKDAGAASRPRRPAASCTALVLAMASPQCVIQPVLRGPSSVRRRAQQRLGCRAGDSRAGPASRVPKCLPQAPCLPAAGRERWGALELRAQAGAAPGQVQAALHVKRLLRVGGQPKVHRPAHGAQAAEATRHAAVKRSKASCWHAGSGNLQAALHKQVEAYTRTSLRGRLPSAAMLGGSVVKSVTSRPRWWYARSARWRRYPLVWGAQGTKPYSFSSYCTSAQASVATSPARPLHA